MKPRMTVPVSLLRDLKRWTWDHDDAEAANELLRFDPDTADLAGHEPADLARGLLRVSDRLHRSLGLGTDACGEWLDAVAHPVRGADLSPVECADAVARAADHERETLALQRRVWRVVGALARGLLATRGDAR